MRNDESAREAATAEVDPNGQSKSATARTITFPVPSRKDAERGRRCLDRRHRYPALMAAFVHHLLADEKRDLFDRIHAVLAPGGRFVLADVVVASDPGHATTTLTPGYDNPSTLAEQLRWLAESGFDARATWVDHDLAVVLARRGAG